MAINGGDVKFSFTGDSSDLNAALAKAGKNLDGLTVAGQGAANKIGKDLNAASKKTGKSLSSFTESAGDADSVMMGLAGAIDLVNPALGDMVRTSGDALAATESMGRAISFSNPIFIALSVAAATLGAAYFLLKEDDEAAEEAAKKHREERDKLADLFKTHAQVVTDLTAKNALLRGETTAYAQALSEAKTGVTSVSMELNKLQSESDAALKSHTDLRKIYEQKFTSTGGFIPTARRLSKEQMITMEESLATVLRLKPALKELSDKQAVEVRLRTENVVLTEAETAAKGRLTKTTKDLADATDAWEDTDAGDAWGFGDSLDDLMAEDKRIYEARIEAREKFVAAQIIINAELDADAEKEIARINKVAAAELKAFEDRLNYAGDFTNATGDLAVALSERLGATAEDQAMTAYIVAQTTALAQIAISTAVSAAKAAEQTGVLAAVTVPAMYALGAVQAAAVLATPPPKFHSGGMIAPDERMITAQTGEAVLSRSGVAAAGGASGVNNLNRGGGGGAIVVVNQYRHRVFDSFIMDNLRRTGSPLAAAIGATGNKAGILR